MGKIIVPANFRIIAHRGASFYAPENTHAAFKEAINQGAKEIELDVRLSADSMVVVCHDASLLRYGHGDRAVSYVPWAELKQLDMSSWFRDTFKPVQHMVTLEETLVTYIDRVTVHVELREESARLCDELLTLIRALRIDKSKIVITSSFLFNLRYLKEKENKLHLAWLVDELTDYVFAEAKALQLFQICPKIGSVNLEAVLKAKLIVPEVRGRDCSGTKEEVSRKIEKLIDCNVDGATIDAPDWFFNEAL